MRQTLLGILTLSLFFTSCKKESCEQNIPQIAFKEIDRGLNTTIIKLTVLDCDGDIGLEQSDTGGFYQYNALIDIRPWLGGNWTDEPWNYVDSTYKEIKDTLGNVIGYDTIYDTLNFYYRVPVVDNQSRSDIYEAVIELDLGTSFFGFDTFRFEARVRDRAKNESETAISDTQFMPGG
jgi:hypothetical protein